jgi:hypothetical protein
MAKKAAKAGRATVYTDDRGDTIAALLADGITLIAVSRLPGMPSERTMRTWALDPQHPFSPKYARGRELGYHKMADQLVEIDIEIDANDKRIRVDTRKWLLSKALPKIYGDKLDLNARLTMTHEQELDLLGRIAAERAAGNGQAVERAGVAQPIKTASR